MKLVYNKNYPGADTYSGKAYKFTNTFTTNSLIGAVIGEQGLKITNETVKKLSEVGYVPLSINVYTEDTTYGVLPAKNWVVDTIAYPTKLALVDPLTIAVAIGVVFTVLLALYLLTPIANAVKEISYNVKETVVPMAWAIGIGIFAIAAGYFVKHVFMPAKYPERYVQG